MPHASRSIPDSPQRRGNPPYQPDIRGPNTAPPSLAPHQQLDPLNHGQQAQQRPHQQAHHQHQTMVQWMNQLHREANYRQMINANQRDRAAMGLNGIQDGFRNPASSQPGTTGHTSPVPSQTHTVVRDTVTPDGHHFRVTVNETVVGPLAGPSPHMAGMNMGGRSETPGPNPQPGNTAARGGLSATEIRNILRGPEATQATQAMTDAMQRSISAASLPGIGNGAPQVGVTVPIGLRQTLSRAASRTATPDPGSGTGATRARSQGPRSNPDVYLMSSPAGVQALVVNNNQVYSTTSIRLPTHPLPLVSPPLPLPLPPPLAQAPYFQPQPVAEDILAQWQQQGQQTPPPRQPAHTHGQQPAHMPQDQDGGQLQPAPARQVLPPNNPGAGAVAAVWPHIWLLVRLVLFVWWFTTPNSSWSRWATVISLAIAVFVVNTGLLDGVANQAWGPFRRHLEGLLPLADANPPGGQEAALVHPLMPAQGNNAGGAPVPPNQPVARAEPDPAQAAARLVEQRREANASWVMDQIRRVERAGLLFLASIAPGVAERHIAHLETEARAERQRREAEEAAAIAAANAAETGERGSGEDQPQEEPLVEI